MATILRFWKRRGNGATDFERLLRPHVRSLYRMAYRLSGNETDAEDLLQELFLRLQDRTREIAKLDHPYSWLARILYRLYVDEYRRTRHRPRPAADYREQANDDGEDPVTRAEGPPERGPDALAQQAHDNQRLQAALARLPEDQRTVVLLHDAEGYRLTELATILDTPVGTLKSRLHRARRRLRELLREGTL